MTYRELLIHVKEHKFTRAFEVVAYLIGWNGSVNSEDFNNIMELIRNGEVKYID